MHELALKNMTEEEKANLSGMKKLGIDLGSGITAGAAAAVLSHVSTPLSPDPNLVGLLMCVIRDIV